MEQQVMFDYHYEEEAERYAFFRIPKALYTEPTFRDLSDGAKVLYGQLLDLMSLSRKNGWIDEDGRVFIRCAIDTIKEVMNCSSGKAVKMLMELDIQTGIGLIEKVKQGQGKSTIIYVKSFVIMKNSSTKRVMNPVIVEETSLYSNIANSRIPNIRIQEYQKIEFKNSNNQHSRISKNDIQEYQEMEFKNSKKAEY